MTPLNAREVAERLAEIAALEDNWDDAGTPKISPGVIESAYRFMNSGYPTPEKIVPTPDGSIIFAWSGLDSRYTEAEIYPEDPSKVEWTSTSDNGKHDNWETTI